VLQHIRSGVLPDQKSDGSPMDATALAAASVPQVDTTVAVPQRPRQRAPRHGGRAEPAQALGGLHHLSQVMVTR